MSVDCVLCRSEDPLMTRLAIFALVSLLLAGCGSGDTPKAHAYSVAQVRRAFLAQGVSLRQAKGPALGVVELVHGGLTVDVVVAHGSISWQSVEAGRAQSATSGNVSVSYSPGYGHAVRSALANLR